MFFLLLAVPQLAPIMGHLALFPEAVINVLISYGRRNRQEASLFFKNRHLVGKLAADCGTWTLNQNREKNEHRITFEGYKHFLKAFADKLDFYVNYDEDFSRKGFETNLAYQLRLEEAGFTPIPVIHDCYGPEVQYYLDRGYKMLSIGSGELKFGSVQELRIIMEPLYEQGIKVHFLGCTDYEKLAYLPVFSSDSSSWTQAGARDYVLFWNLARSGFDKTDKVLLTQEPSTKMKGLHYKVHPFINEFEEYLDRELGFSIEEIVGNGSMVILKRQIINIHYFLDLEAQVNKKHAELGFNLD